MKQTAIFMAIISFLIFAFFGTVMSAFCCNIPGSLALGAIAGHLAGRLSGPGTNSQAVSTGVKAALLASLGAILGYFLHATIIGGLVGIGVASDPSVENGMLSGATSVLTMICIGAFSGVLSAIFMGLGGALGGWFFYKNHASAGWTPQPAGSVIDVAVARPSTVVPLQITSPASPDTSGGKFARHPDRGACGVCMKSLPPGEGYEIPADAFYGSKEYQDWLVNSPLGQMVIPGAGGIDAYLEKARSRRGNSPVLACTECLHLFMAAPAAAAAPPKPENPPVRAEARRATPVLRPAEAKPAVRKPIAPRPEPGPDLSGGRYHRLEEGGICDVCAAAMEPGEGYRIPVDVFYSSEKYRRWLMESPIGQMAIPMAGGIDAYIQSARAQDHTAWSGVCGRCVDLFP